MFPNPRFPNPLSVLVVASLLVAVAGPTVAGEVDEKRGFDLGSGLQIDGLSAEPGAELRRDGTGAGRQPPLGGFGSPRFIESGEADAGKSGNDDTGGYGFELDAGPIEIGDGERPQ